MTLQEYASQIAEAVLHVCEHSGLSDLDAEDVRESLSDLIASVPSPEVQHHDDVQAQIDAAYLRGAKDQAKALSRADIDAAVARERDRVIGIFVGELQKLHENTVLDCGDNSCLFATRRGGMRTNGGCRCIERLLDAAVAREREEIAADAAELVALVGHCDYPECKGKWCVTARTFIEKIRARSGAHEG